MKLELYIRGSFMVEVELKTPVDKYMDFKGNYELRESYVKLMIAALKNKYQRAIGNYEWEIFLVAESKASEIEELEPEINLN